jgi:predicted O-methyltransferase YrrM
MAIERPVTPWAQIVQIARLANDHYSMTERQQELVYELAMTIPERGLIVELGVCHGKTALILAAAAKQRDGKYLGIDNWSLEGNRQEVASLFNQLMHGLGVRVSSEHSRQASQWGGSYFAWSLVEDDTHAEHWRGNSAVVDLLLIDAGHDEANVSKDCEIWIPKVKAGGLVIFDDWPSGPNWQGSCHEAVRRHAEIWTGEWEWAASYGKVVARRKPL